MHESNASQAPSPPTLPRLVSAVLFDCDGVLLDSNAMKMTAFAQTLRPYDPQAVEAFAQMQRQSFGRSRYELLDRFVQEFLPPGDPRPDPAKLVKTFGDKSRQGYRQTPETAGCRRCLEQLHRQVPLWVVSGTDQSELRDVLREKQLDGFFQDILGSPTPKTELVTRLCASLKDRGRGAVLVGDSRADLEAAAASQVAFVFVSGYSAAPESMMALARTAGFPTIQNLRSLPQLLQLESSTPMRKRTP